MVATIGALFWFPAVGVHCLVFWTKALPPVALSKLYRKSDLSKLTLNFRQIFQTNLH